jgi:hypothetical protein
MGHGTLLKLARMDLDFGLEFEPYSEFEIAHRSIGRLVLDYACIAAVDTPSRVAGVHVIEQVECVQTELRVQPFWQNREGLHERRVGLRPARTC